MSEVWGTNPDEEDNFSLGFIFKGEHLWIQGVHITSFDCPVCLEAEYDLDVDEYDDESFLFEEQLDCQLCEFFEPDTCPICKDPNTWRDIITLFEIYRNIYSTDYRRYLEQRQTIVEAILTELRGHGRPLHYTVIAEMVGQRYPELFLTAPRILRIMARRSNLFIRIDEGVYMASD